MLEKSRWVIVLVIVSSALINGCANWSYWQSWLSPGKELAPDLSTYEQNTYHDLVAEDFIHAMQQIDQLQPQLTTIQLLRSRADEPFIQAMAVSLSKLGYGVRWLSADKPRRLLHYRVAVEAATENAERLRFDLAIDDIELRRTYLVDQFQSVHPVTPMYVRGADAEHIELNDTKFNLAMPSAVDKPRSFELPAEVNPLKTLAALSSDKAPLKLPTVAQATVQNVFELGMSNYEELLLQHRVIEEKILTFPNDSLRLGSVNKQMIEQLVDQYDPSSDMFSIIGCSIGPTAVEGGNAALALGRASRVKEALLFAGVSPSKILDEGCWAGDHAKHTLPKRGVVITLNRAA